MQSMSSNWTKRESSMEFPYTKEVGVITLQFRKVTEDNLLTWKQNYLNDKRQNYVLKSSIKIFGSSRARLDRSFSFISRHICPALF